MLWGVAEEICVKIPRAPFPGKENASQGWNQDPGASSDSTRLRSPPRARTWRSFPQAAGGESEESLSSPPPPRPGARSLPSLAALDPENKGAGEEGDPQHGEGPAQTHRSFPSAGPERVDF